MVLSLEPVATARLTLPLWTAAEVELIRQPRTPSLSRRLDELGVRWHPEFPRPDDVDAASLWHEGDVWGPRSIVRGVTVLGSIGFFGPPSAAEDGVAETEVGYGLVREAWGWGFATEALRGLVGAAGDVRLRATVLPDNKASIRVLAKCGFTQLRGTTPEGELVMVRPLQESPASR